MYNSDFFAKNSTAVNKRVLATASISIGFGYLIYKYKGVVGNWNWRKLLTWVKSAAAEPDDKLTILNANSEEPVAEPAAAAAAAAAAAEEDIIADLYEYHYIDDFKNKEFTDKTDDELHNLLGSYVIEETPDGKVAMTYDHTIRKFLYYADNIILFKYLETISRKYAIIYDCDKIYVDIANEIYKGKVKLLDEFKKDDEIAESNKNKELKSVFANFKSYNSKASNKQGKGKWLLLEHSNNYINKGKLADYQKILSPPVEANPAKKITFADYRKTNVAR